MDWKDVGQKIADVAPLLGSVVSDYVPGGKIGVGIITAIASAFGTDATPDSIAGALETDDARIKLVQIQTAHEATLLQIDADRLAQILADRQDARNREIEVRKQRGGKPDAFQVIVGSIILIGFFIFLALIIFFPLQPASLQIVTYAAGGLTGSVTTIVAYYYGSSRGSAQKTAMMTTKGATP